MDKKKKDGMVDCGCELKVNTKKTKKEGKVWKKPELTDVSARVMAQPYIRFT